MNDMNKIKYHRCAGGRVVRAHDTNTVDPGLPDLSTVKIKVSMPQENK